MARTEKGIIYPGDYDKTADIPKDLKEMAESIDVVLVEQDDSIKNLDDKYKEIEKLIGEIENSLEGI